MSVFTCQKHRETKVLDVGVRHMPLMVGMKTNNWPTIQES